MMEENISAIATPAGKGGVAIIRISGKNPLQIAEKMFKPVGKVKVADFEPYRMYPGQIDAGNFCDYGLCVYFKGPASYTGEDIIEFQCHGGESVARGILKQTFRMGAKPAGRGMEMVTGTVTSMGLVSRTTAFLLSLVVSISPLAATSLVVATRLYMGSISTVIWLTVAVSSLVSTFTSVTVMSM